MSDSRTIKVPEFTGSQLVKIFKDNVNLLSQNQLDEISHLTTSMLWDTEALKHDGELGQEGLEDDEVSGEF